MKSKDLLNHLSELEAKLNNFSFEELTSNDASKLKSSFISFKKVLEQKVNQRCNISNSLADGKTLEHITDSPIDPNTNQLRAHNNEEMLIAMVSHEMRNPLNGIIGFTDLLKESALTSEQLSHANAIHTASNTLMDIINELLEYSKLSAGLEKFEQVDFNFYRIIRDVMYLCNTLIMNKNVSLEVDIDTAIPEVLKGDPSKLSQVLLNLLGNAIKFVDQGGICLGIHLKKQFKNTFQLEFDVTDTGIGISKDDIKHIFDSFKQATPDTFSKYGGSGLGLSIVKQIIENQGGDIKVHSSLGIGTTFTFTLPFQKGNANQLSPTVATNSMNTENVKLIENMRILVFEDNVLNQKLIGQRLKAWKCVSFITENALYGLHVLEHNHIDLVIMDLRMPKMNGFQITKRIRSSENPMVKQVPIIALTADFSLTDKAQCNAYGIDDFILKPYSPDELLSQLIEKRNQMSSLQVVESDVINPDLNLKKINLEPILKDCMGEIDLLEELISIYKNNALEFIGKAKLHIQQQDFEELEFAAHKIKSGLAMMQTYGLHAIVDQIYKGCKGVKDFKHLEFLYQCFLEEYPLVEEELNQAIKALKQS